MHTDVTPASYGATFKWLHWFTALLIIALLLLGWTLTSGLISSGQLRAALYGLHKSMGIAVLLVTLFRIVWRTANAVPPIPPTLKPWEIKAAGAVHKILYGLLLLQPLTGWMIYTVSSHKSLFFWLFPIPDLPYVASLGNSGEVLPLFEGSHGALATILVLVLILHVGAALKHHFLAKDNVLLRMSPGVFAPLLRRLRGER
jgi:cytochrome b561